MKRFFGVLAMVACVLPVQTQAQQGPVQQSEVDLLTITKIENIRPAGGLDGAGTAGFAALGAAVAAASVSGATAVVTAGTGGIAGAIAAPVAAANIYSAAGSGASVSVAAAKFLDGSFSGQDDLVVQLIAHGEEVVRWPADNYQPMIAGQVITPNIEASFRGSIRLGLVEYDSGSKDDDLGTLEIAGGKDDSFEGALLLAPAAENGSIYRVSFRVDKGKGDIKAIPAKIKCGVENCKSARLDSSSLDRDADLEDLRSCPSGYIPAGYQTFPQFLVKDVYLRLCDITPITVVWGGCDAACEAKSDEFFQAIADAQTKAQEASFSAWQPEPNAEYYIRASRNEYWQADDNTVLSLTGAAGAQMKRGPDRNFGIFIMEPQAHGSYRIRVKGDNRYLSVKSQQALSTECKPDVRDACTHFFVETGHTIESEADPYFGKGFMRLRVACSQSYLHKDRTSQPADTTDLLTTRLYITPATSDELLDGPAAATLQPCVPSTTSTASTLQPSIPLLDALLGEYENLLYAADGKNDWHYVTISKINDQTVKWTNRAGVSWTLTLTDDRNVLNVGTDSPYFATMKQVSVVWKNGQVTGLNYGEPYIRK